MWVFIESEPGLWTVGFYDPEGKWQAESDHAKYAERRRSSQFPQWRSRP